MYHRVRSIHLTVQSRARVPSGFSGKHKEGEPSTPEVAAHVQGVLLSLARSLPGLTLELSNEAKIG